MRHMTKRLQDKACIITGAGQGIGRAIAVAFAAEGARLVVNDVDGAAANALVKELAEGGAEAVANYDAIGTVRAAESLVQSTLDAFGEIDVLVNNAGILRDRMIH